MKNYRTKLSFNVPFNSEFGDVPALFTINMVSIKFDKEPGAVFRGLVEHHFQVASQEQAQLLLSMESKDFENFNEAYQYLNNVAESFQLLAEKADLQIENFEIIGLILDPYNCSDWAENEMAVILDFSDCSWMPEASFYFSHFRMHFYKPSVEQFEKIYTALGNDQNEFLRNDSQVELQYQKLFDFDNISQLLEGLPEVVEVAAKFGSSEKIEIYINESLSNV